MNNIYITRTLVGPMVWWDV